MEEEAPKKRVRITVELEVDHTIGMGHCQSIGSNAVLEAIRVLEVLGPIMETSISTTRRRKFHRVNPSRARRRRSENPNTPIN